MKLDDALIALKSISLNLKSEIVPIENALNKELAEDIIANKNAPSFDNSALDGYAAKRADLEKGTVRVVDVIYAGERRQTRINDGECIKIMTGAKMPVGADCVLKFEDAIIKDKENSIQNAQIGEYVLAAKIPKPNDGYRKKAEEIVKNDKILNSGTRLNPAQIMLLAAQGISRVLVKKAPSVGIYSSGNELKEPWQSADDEEIYNANSAGVAALLASAGVKSSYLGIIKDDINAVKRALEAKIDVLIISGGASAGEADFMAKALGELKFKEIFSHVKIRPGKPVKAYFKQDEKRLVFILPGNPMAAFITAFALILPLFAPQNTQMAVVRESLKFNSGRTNTILGNVKNGEFIPLNGGKYSSGSITPLANSNAIIFTDYDENEILAGSVKKIYKIS
ncbi:molybdopterin molybdotransferase MoeA [Campylobacter sp. 19-13652]|uniref:molybdopterin molybdotransferase MoeA n=1 Tax=Campylobacter sp. 19-13652 TaxID=2840180 RepID=UPI001C76132E|nr:molybdopterin molybdotransferase MoeA [Campylobacter sp. 19-13652]BCX79428.1 molybdopterin molybdenumtransferase MoeA [Campylobacter sp. 19-13652]